MYTWTIPGKKNHSPTWYLFAGIFTVSLAIWGIFSEIYALAVAVFILAGVYIMLENNAPDTIDAIVNENGVGIGDSFYDFGQLIGFSIVFDDKIPKNLRIRTNRKTLGVVDIPLTQDINSAELRAFLVNYIAEEESAEIGFMDRLLERISL